MGAMNRVGIGLLYWPAGLHRLAESILGIDSWAPYKFKNTTSDSCVTVFFMYDDV